MEYIFIVVFGILGIFLGRSLALKRQKKCIESAQTENKTEGKTKILEYLKTNQKIANNEVEILLNVSDSTAERYLNELEKEEKIVQHGEIGHAVFYSLK